MLELDTLPIIFATKMQIIFQKYKFIIKWSILIINAFTCKIDQISSVYLEICSITEWKITKNICVRSFDLMINKKIIRKSLCLLSLIYICSFFYRQVNHD